ncbi:hypothetical protein [Mycobacteroides abscessus]|uniref:hypothetical protein n=1 Tax=Mycobacteroides abscessus TaxID=36809 RepID=UPI0004689ED0|nr:hypothetical protein [Mycobacteroides abscessus]MDM2419917.1 hypothetical protein [Mycobacteroides abscessus]MDM2423740.1 hypothetical protein [Mycobacteroides abscessus]MDM2428430.1 hypothetical protein [Mycobacteroides abscessus]MDM2433688.1 hypothetical protein [Mycobacteroides abscessus]MDM2440742.1 hypothetical protein [Mycobacteroides abscessus]
MTDIDERALTLDDVDPEELAEKSAAGSGESLAKQTNTKPAEQTKAIDPEPETAVTDGRPNIWKWIAIGLLALGIAGAVFGAWRYQNLSTTLSTMRTADTERTAAIDAASAYAMKSLTYSYEDPDGFFKNVKTDAAEPLKNKYSDAEKLLKAIMLQAQVTSKGEIIAADAVAQQNGIYQVVVTTRQTTRNVQNPEPRATTLVLQITVKKEGDGWQITDIGPKNASSTGTIMHPGDQKLLPEEAASAPGKAPVPAPSLPPLPALPGQK